jgi:DNA-binding NtrC family response regulator
MPKRDARVLLVEDHRGLRLTLADILRNADMKVDTASDATAAFGKLARGHYDVAIVDMVLLPGPSGIEVIRRIKANSPATRVFACTAYYQGDLLAEAWELGIEQVIFKPVDPVLLLDLIRKPVGHAPGDVSQTPGSGSRVPGAKVQSQWHRPDSLSSRLQDL